MLYEMLDVGSDKLGNLFIHIIQGFFCVLKGFFRTQTGSHIKF